MFLQQSQHCLKSTQMYKQEEACNFNSFSLGHSLSGRMRWVGWLDHRSVLCGWMGERGKKKREEKSGKYTQLDQQIIKVKLKSEKVPFVVIPFEFFFRGHLSLEVDARDPESAQGCGQTDCGDQEVRHEDGKQLREEDEDIARE